MLRHNEIDLEEREMQHHRAHGDRKNQSTYGKSKIMSQSFKSFPYVWNGEKHVH